jgi:phosphoglycerol transferase
MRWPRCLGWRAGLQAAAADRPWTTRAFAACAPYVFAALLALAVLTCVLKLWQADPRVPLAVYGGDGLQTQAYIQGVADRGWYLRNDRLGYPFGQEMYDFPMVDNLHFLLLKLLARVLPSTTLAFNAYYLLTYPLTAVTALFVCRRFGLSCGPSLFAALLYAFLPYHMWRSQGHLFLASYYLVPLSVLTVLAVYLDRLALPRWLGRFAEARGPGLLSLWFAGLIQVLQGSAGAYYCAFACFFLVVAGALGSWQARRFRPLLTALVLIGVTLTTVVLNAAPVLRYRSKFGVNPQVGQRWPAEAEIFGLKIVQMLVPMPNGHRLGYLNDLAERYIAPPTPLVNENRTAWLGTIGAVAFVVLLLSLLRPRPRPDGSEVVPALARLTFGGVLLGTIGGFGMLFNLLVFAQVRCYNRISVYLGFFALLAAATWLEQWRRRAALSWAHKGAYQTALLLLVVVGLLDQTSPALVPGYARLKALYRHDAAFIATVEQRLPAGAAVYQLPYAPFPEGGWVGAMRDYDHLRPYVHSRTLRWSYGCMKGRPADQWQHDVLLRPLPERVSVLVLAGFSAVYFDRAGFAQTSSAEEAEWASLLGESPLVSADGRMAVYSLVAYRDALAERLGSSEWDRLKDDARHPISTLWGAGFHPTPVPSHPTPPLLEREAELALVNPSARPRRVRLRAVFTPTDGGGRLRVSGPDGDHEMIVGTAGAPYAWESELSPGPQRLQFSYAPDRDRPPTPARVRLDEFWVDEPGLMAACGCASAKPQAAPATE